ncbi:MAG: S8 family serine peptidase [Patescibacteria group bacterium]
MRGTLWIFGISTACALAGVIAMTSEPAAAVASESRSIVVQLRGRDTVSAIPIGSAENVGALLSRLADDPRIEHAQLNHDYQAVATPNDPLRSSQTYLPVMHAQRAWDTATGSKSVTVAILDTGMDIDHPDFSGNLWTNTGEIAANGVDDDRNGYIDDRNGWNIVDNTSDPNPQYDAGWTESGIHHGTAIAGVIGARGNNAQGITGINWRVNTMPVRVLKSTGAGNTRDVYNGIRYAMRNGADFINLSFVGTNEDALLARVIKEATEAGIIVFAAAGNDNLNLNVHPRYPVCTAYVVGVGGTDLNDRRFTVMNGSTITGGSNYGSNCIDLVAPAKNIYTTAVYDPLVSHPVSGAFLDEYYGGGWTGTSLASPMVAGAAALIKSYNASLTGLQITQLLKQSAVNIDGLNPSVAGHLGAGRVDLAALMATQLPTAHALITGAGNTGAPHVRVLNTSGTVQSQFFAYASTFRGGVYVASGDVTGDGQPDIITGAGNTGAPHVRVLNASGTVQSQFFAYASTFRGGVYVASGDVDGDGIDEIITGAGVGGGPHVRIFDYHGTVKDQFFAYATEFRGGVQVAAGDVDGDGIDEIITGAGNTGAPHVRILTASGAVQSQFFAYTSTFRGGVHVAVMQ